jgi:hypothetical protein
MTYKTPESPSLEEWMQKYDTPLRLVVPTGAQALFTSSLPGVHTRLGNVVGVGKNPLEAVALLVESVEGHDVCVGSKRTVFSVSPKGIADTDLGRTLDDLDPRKSDLMVGVMEMAKVGITTTIQKAAKAEQGWTVGVDARVVGNEELRLNEASADPKRAMVFLNRSLSAQAVSSHGAVVQLPELQAVVLEQEPSMAR